MSDDLNKKIKQITDALSQENLPDNLKGLLSLLAGAGSSEASSPKADDTQSMREDKTEKANLDENVEMLNKVRKVMEKMNTRSDPRVNLLYAIKPFLNSKRQTKINNCINLLRVTSLAKLMDENDKGLL